MAKITITKEWDIYDKMYYKLSKKRGKISQREAYEAMGKEGLEGRFLMDFPVPDEAPVSYYEEGDFWILYPVDELLGEKAELKFNEGYEACMKDYKLGEDS